MYSAGISVFGFEKRGCVGVYLDDMYCGTEISGNIFYQVPRAAFIGGGRDCRILNENNLLETDPEFADPENLDFRLQECSIL